MADGTKLAPLIIFKAQDRSTIYKQLQKDEHVLKKDCYVECNTNAWSTTIIIERWFNNIWNKYLNSKDLLTDGVVYRIMDKATFHYDSDILQKFTNENKFISFIPSGLTRYLQPLDVSVNKIFKSAIKEKYIQYCISNGNENIKVSRTNIIDWICSVWNNDEIISRELIYNSFRCTGIGNNLNGSEDHMFTAWKHMQEEKPLIDDDICEILNEKEILDSDSE